MLASILPGFRDLRTPLVAGYLLLLSAWLAFGQEVAPDDGDRITKRVNALPSFFGAAAGLAAVSLAAYLIGSLVTIHRINRADRRWPKRFRKERDLRYDVTRWINESAQRQFHRGIDGRNLAEARVMPMNFNRGLMDVLEHQFPDGDPAGSEDLDDEQIAWRRQQESQSAILYSLQANIQLEFDLLVTRMQIERESLWNDYDRVRSEAELRFTIFAPLALLTIVCAFVWPDFRRWWAHDLADLGFDLRKRRIGLFGSCYYTALVRRRWLGSVGRGGEVEEPGWFGQLEGGQDGLLAWGGR